MNEILENFDIVFRAPERLSSIPLIALFFLILFWAKYRAARVALKNPWILGHLAGARLPSLSAYIVSFGALVLGSALLAGVWAEPEWKIKTPEPVYGTVRISFLLDGSLSMVYGEDVAPTRLAAAKKMVAKFVRMLREDAELKGEYELALIPFAGGAIPSYSSFTTSHGEFLWLLENINKNTISRQGTSFLAALEAYKILLKRSRASKSNTSDLAILISDGGKEEGMESERGLLEKSLKTLDPRTVIYTVGIGSKERDKACLSRHAGDDKEDQERACVRTKPVRLVVRDADGVFVDYLREDPRDPKSKVLSSELDEATLKFIATSAPGDTLFTKRNYRFFTDTEDMAAAFKDFVVRERTRVGTSYSYRYEPVLVWFLVPAFLIFFFFFGFGGWITRFLVFLLKCLR